MASKVRQAVLIAGSYGWCGNYYYHSEIGNLIYQLGLKADKFDVLNRLYPGVWRKVVTFARGDIRYKRPHGELFCLLILAFAILLIIATLRNVLAY